MVFGVVLIYAAVALTGFLTACSFVVFKKGPMLVVPAP